MYIASQNEKGDLGKTYMDLYLWLEVLVLYTFVLVQREPVLLLFVWADSTAYYGQIIFVWPSRPILN